MQQSAKSSLITIRITITTAVTFVRSLPESARALYHCRTTVDNFSVQMQYGIGGLFSSLDKNTTIQKVSFTNTKFHYLHFNGSFPGELGQTALFGFFIHLLWKRIVGKSGNKWHGFFRARCSLCYTANSVKVQKLNWLRFYVASRCQSR